MVTQIYRSLTASILQRVTCASLVGNLLRIWCLWAHRTGTLKLKANLISRETFHDVFHDVPLACHHSMLIIKACRDFAPAHSVCIERTGTNCCAGRIIFQPMDHLCLITTISLLWTCFVTWTKWIGCRNSCLNVLEQHIHVRQSRGDINIWHKGYYEWSGETPNMMAFPSDAELDAALQAGLQLAYEELKDCWNSTRKRE